MAGVAKRKKSKAIKRKIKKFNRKTFLVANLRRISYKYYYRNEALRQAKVAPNLFKCNHCGQDFQRTDIKIDHVIPVVDVKTGFTNWDDYINRMFPENVEGFQCLCTVCHNSKTSVENTMRKSYRKKVKKNVVKRSKK